MRMNPEESARMRGICEDCRHSLMTNPTSQHLLKRLGYALWILGEYEEVEEVCTRILLQDPNDVDWIYSRAMAHLGLGQIDQATTDLIEARSKTDDHRILAVIAEALQSIEGVRLQQEDGLAA
jgi:hypothetical protein